MDKEELKERIDNIFDECEMPQELIERLDEVSTELCEVILEDVEDISNFVLLMTFAKLCIAFSEHLKDEAKNPVQAIISGVVLESTIQKLDEIHKDSIETFNETFNDWDT